MHFLLRDVVWAILVCTSCAIVPITIDGGTDLASSGMQITEKDYFGFIPEYQVSLFPGYAATWSAPCFKNTSAIATITPDGAEIIFTAEDASSPLCADRYLVATPQSFHYADLLFHGTHKVQISPWKENELAYVQYYGFQVLRMQGGIIETFEAIYATYQLFAGKQQQQSILQFMKEDMNLTLQARNAPPVMLNQSQYMSGDALFVFKMDGDHGGENTIEAFGTGGRADHVAILLEIDGVLYVTESLGGGENEQNGIVKTPYAQWMQAAAEQQWLVGLARLAPEYRAKYNNDLAVQFFESIEGQPYGYHNYIFGWIDTPFDNYPPPISAQLMAIIFQLTDDASPNTSNEMWGEALNKRLGTEGLNMSQILTECESRNISFYDLMAVPEQDGWVYSGGNYSYVCSAYVIGVYKAAGVFGNITIQATEFTPKDAYQVALYYTDGSQWQPEECITTELQTQGIVTSWCQLTGNFVLDLPGFSSIAPYDNMNERCGALPPDYVRSPEGC